MAACTQYSKLTVVGSSISEINGDYIPAGLKTTGNITTGTEQYTVFSKDGSLTSVPRIEIVISVRESFGPLPEGGFGLFVTGKNVDSRIIVNLPFVGTYAHNKVIAFNIPLNSSVTEYSCDYLGFYTSGPGGGGTCTITGTLAPPITLRNNKYATATESGDVRFRRLVGLGYV